MSGALRTGGLGAVLCLLAGAFAVPSLYVPGVALVLLAVGASALVGAAAGSAALRLELPPGAVEEDAGVALALHLEGRFARLCRASLQPAPDAPWRLVREREVRLELRPQRRGRHVVGPAVVRFADPFGVCVRERRSERRELLVLPRVQALPRGAAAAILSLPTAQARGLDGGVEGVGPYRPGAPASRIHWLTAARTGTLMERRGSAAGERAPVTIVLDPHGAAGAEALDMAVRAAASLCVGLARRGGCELLLPGEERASTVAADLAAWPPLHARLALVDGNGAPWWAAVAQARRVVLVCAGGLDSAPAPTVACTVAPTARAGQPLLFRVAGCAVQAAGSRRESHAA